MLRLTVPAFLLLATPALAQLPAGWNARADKGDATGLKFAAMGNGFHVSPGQAGVYYREADKTGGKFHATVTFTQTKAPTHPEGYGVVFAGSDLAGDKQKYVYFLIRGDGMYLVKKRDGAETPSVVGWTASDAIIKADAEGKATNKVEVDASGAKVAFKVNGKSVYELDLPEAQRAGIVGLRVNHGLDVHIADYQVHKIG
jgi:hypothetical protein